MEHLEDAESAKTSNNKLASQESTGGAGGVSSYYRPTRRGSPRPSTHNNFDINEHLPWMIVLLLLLVLVVIVVCSVKRSSRVLKKGPMQDPSSIMEKAIQKKPAAPPAQVKEKWIYYSNGQGECHAVSRQHNVGFTHALAHVQISDLAHDAVTDIILSKAKKIFSPIVK